MNETPIFDGRNLAELKTYDPLMYEWISNYILKDENFSLEYDAKECVKIPRHLTTTQSYLKDGRKFVDYWSSSSKPGGKGCKFIYCQPLPA